MTIEEILTNDEGLRLKPYKDTVGKMTIGVGRNLDDVGITLEEANYLLRNDITRVQTTLFQQLPIFKDMPDRVQTVLVCMAFNMGVGGLMAFKKFLYFLADGDFDNASAEMLNSRWANQVGQRAVRLSKLIKEP